MGLINFIILYWILYRLDAPMHLFELLFFGAFIRFIWWATDKR